jgi:ABC-2 type transport system ATP-binding protein
MTVNEFLCFIAEARKVKRSEIRSHVERINEKTGLTDVAERLIKNLSKGYKQRVGIAQAIVGDPETIILDEPTVGLDIMAVEELKKMMREYANHGKTVFVTSHNIDLVAKLCDRVAIVNQGKVMSLFDLNREPNRRIQLSKIFMETYRSH